MNAPADFATARAQRHDGWTPDRQRAFLEAIAEGHTVDNAARLAGLSAAAAYAFRRRAPGAPFALGWSAANLLAREKLAATLYARAIDGYVETMTRPDGTSVERHRFDNRLATTMLARLDRQADNPDQGSAAAAARLVAQEFDGFLDLIERDEGPARAGLFLNARAAGEADLAPVVALARADRYCRTGAGHPSEVDTADLDPAAREGWTAEQWQRAEAAGLFVLAPQTSAEADAGGPLLSQLHQDGLLEPEPQGPVWWNLEERSWWTSFPPDKDFVGREDGEYGDDDYSRTLSTEEEVRFDAAYELMREEELRDKLATESAERDQFFATLPQPEKGARQPGEALDWTPEAMAVFERVHARVVNGEAPEGELDPDDFDDDYEYEDFD